jgi:hypothetical protein
MEFVEISLLIKLFTGALLTFFAILLWSKTNDTAWVLICIGTVFFYAEIIFSTLKSFGILEGFIINSEFDIISIILINFPIILYTIAFIIVILRRRN